MTNIKSLKYKILRKRGNSNTSVPKREEKLLTWTLLTVEFIYKKISYSGNCKQNKK